MRSTKYTREFLAPIVASSNTLSDVLRKLGLNVTGGNHRHIWARIRQSGLDTSHFHQRSLAGGVRVLSKDALVALVRDSISIAQILTKLELPTVGRPHHTLKQRLRELDIDTTHFLGQGWSRGETSASHPSVARSKTWSDEQLFVENGPPIGGPRLTRRLLTRGWQYRCVWCAIDKWRDQPLVLHLDHINGINNDHRLENLRFLCPNCHSQTETYSNNRRSLRR